MTKSMLAQDLCVSSYTNVRKESDADTRVARNKEKGNNNKTKTS